MTDVYDSRPDTLAHIARVQELMERAQAQLAVRAYVHDASKLESPEKEAFDRGTQGLKGLVYGSDEYRQSFAKYGMKDAIKHHYANNTHHPEHYENGIDGMSLFDLVEMLCDWKAASERHETGDIVKSLEINKERFHMSDQLAQVFSNTVNEFGWT